MGRATQGVRLINLKGSDSIAGLAKSPKEEDEDEESGSEFIEGVDAGEGSAPDITTENETPQNIVTSSLLPYINTHEEESEGFELSFLSQPVRSYFPAKKFFSTLPSVGRSQRCQTMTDCLQRCQIVSVWAKTPKIFFFFNFLVFYSLKDNFLTFR